MGVCGEPESKLRRAYTQPKKQDNENFDMERKNTKTKKNNKKVAQKKEAESSKDLVNSARDIERKIEKQNTIRSERDKKNIGKSIYIRQSTRGTSILPEEYIAFPKGQHYYQLTKDENLKGSKTVEIKISDSLSEKIELFFSLDNVCNPMDDHSFGISIINNKQIGTKTFLGNLQNSKGDKIEFGESFIVDFFFEREQIIIIEPKINGKKTGQKYEFVLCKLMTNKDNKLAIKIKDIGTLEVSYKKLNNKDMKLINEISCFQFSITLTHEIFEDPDNLENIYYVIKNIKDGKKRRPVYKSYEYKLEYKQKKQTTLISLESDFLCNNNNELIFFELYCPSINQSSCIGYSTFTLNKLKSNFSKDCSEKTEIKSKYYGDLGMLYINYNTTTKISFEQFVKSGQINLDIAIDYTESNGKPEDPSSLHYINGKDDYEDAIKSCGDIIAYYDYDQLFPVYGFGGIPPNENEVNHCFNINFNENPEIQGIDKIIEFYKRSLTEVKFYGPTHFAPVINKVINEVNDDLENRKEENHYYILMILTDGIIIDMKETIDCIVEGSNLPLSIVIIGIGKADFTNMEILDGDEEPLIDSFGNIRKRDIVQFVRFEDFKKNNKINNGTELAEEVLKEIPRQIEEYFMFCGKFYKSIE